MAHKSTAEIKRLLKETTKMGNADAAKHLGISMPTFYKWKAKAKVIKVQAPKATSKKVINLVAALKDKLSKLEKELA